MSNSVLKKWASCKKVSSQVPECTSKNEAYLREFNKGKSFEYSVWQPLVTYTNDSMKQDFVRYENVILACKTTHVSSNPPELIYSNSGRVIGVLSEEWEFVISQNIIHNNYFIDGNNASGLGIPIFSKEMLENMDSDDIPNPYISFDDTNEVDETSNIDILFSAVRKLQAEVAKMRNAFKYGMYSYTGKETAISSLIDEDVEEKDALWSVDESDLSEISGYVLDFEGTNFPFIPTNVVDITNPGVVTFLDKAVWGDDLLALRNLKDPKLYTYMTVSDLNICFNLNSHSSENTLSIDFSKVFNLNKVDKYNIIVLISRKTKNEDDDEYYGFNYIWISIRNYQTNTTLAEGFYNIWANSLDTTMVELNDRYYINSIIFDKLSLYKLNFYSKYQDFSNEIIPSVPDDTDYKYRVAHLTIRSVKDYAELEYIQNKLPNNELIWEEASRKLWIKSNDTLISIGNSTNLNTGMTETEVIELLQNMGIVYIENDGTLQLSNIGSATFINGDTGKKFNFEVNPEGDLVSTPLPDKTLAERIAALTNTNSFSKENSFRGFVAKLHCGEAKENAAKTGDVGINSDRVKIGAVYCPLTTDTKFGCSHGYIELENTSDKDFPLGGVYLHYLHPTNNGHKVEHLGLKGILKAGSTYLIRCKQYADPTTSSDVYINVDSYDQEWYVNGELLDLSNDGTNSYGFALTYENSDITPATELKIAGVVDNDKQNPYWPWYFIDSLILNEHYGDKITPWGIGTIKVKSNSITKNTFELDPAKQAFQALTTYDSSRRRTEKYGTDGQSISLDSEFIAFPHSDLIYPVNKFAPKSSKQKKNVSTDKTGLNLEKPNIVNCSFGMNTFTTRCFNWISAGSFDEYVFIKNGDTWDSFESYTQVDTSNTEGTSYPRRKEYSDVVNNTIYARIQKTFPGCGIKYTAHKCVIKVSETAVEVPTTYTYIVGRKNKDGTPDFNHCSAEQTFTLYPSSYTPRIYQITDQQGFHWIEYQVWSAAAKQLNEKILSDCENENIIPVLINTGDMTQNGTRINEWLDYHNGGLPLFSHLEQMNVVGNNDLCGTDPEVLGTGDDVGKSNGFYFHVFHCYDVPDKDSKACPIITVGNSTIEYKYVPSLYYFDFATLRIVMVNSEITYVNCRDWYKKTLNNKVVNVYSGWTCEDGVAEYDGSFTSIYTMVYNMLDTTMQKIVACHEMPFTVMTSDSLKNNENIIKNWRSYSGTGTSLIGSHLNQINGTDRVGIYWFSRLLEHHNVKLCLGGHKHTYAATYPVREYYYYDDGAKNSYTDGKMEMEETLINDTKVSWFDGDGRNLTKYPIANVTISNHGLTTHIDPYTQKDDLDDGVTYFMCQATGYKLTSNKELPSNYQEFSCLIPETTLKDGSPTADGNQQYPMFVVVTLNNTDYNIALARFTNILNADYKFTQLTHGTEDIAIQYAQPQSESRYCEWDTIYNPIISCTWN